MNSPYCSEISTLGREKISMEKKSRVQTFLLNMQFCHINRLIRILNLHFLEKIAQKNFEIHILENLSRLNMKRFKVVTFRL